MPAAPSNGGEGIKTIKCWQTLKLGWQQLLYQHQQSWNRPGAAHISRMMSPGWGSNTWTQTIDGKFCGNAKSLAKSANDGATYNGSVIRTPTPALPQKRKYDKPDTYVLFVIIFTVFLLCITKVQRVFSNDLASPTIAGGGLKSLREPANDQTFIRQRGRPKKSWWDCVRGDIASYGLSHEDAQDRDHWRLRIKWNHLTRV